jgi:RNA polymerase primary sigma factor
MRQLKITKKITSKESESINNYFAEVSKIKLLTNNEEYDLLEKISEGDQKAIDDLVKANLRFVISVAKQYQHQGMPLEDLINEGNIGLIKAATKFDRNRGFKFISYAVWWIRQSITQCIYENSRLIRIPNNQNAQLNKINRTSAQLEQVYHREPTNEELQEALNLNAKDIRDTLNYSIKTVSLDTPVSDEGATSLIDMVKNHNVDSPDESFIREGFRKDLEKVINQLESRQRMILCMYFGITGYQPMTLEEIGDYFQLTRERVRQIKDSALRILKCRNVNKILRQHFN